MLILYLPRATIGYSGNFSGGYSRGLHKELKSSAIVILNAFDLSDWIESKVSGKPLPETIHKNYDQPS